MAHFIFILTGLFFIILTPAAWAADFSHEAHRKVVPQCTSCHVAGELPKPDSCTSCHPNGTVSVSRKAARKSALQKPFSHAVHMKLGNVAPVLAKAIDSGAYLGKFDQRQRDSLNLVKDNCSGCHRLTTAAAAAPAAVAKPGYPVMAECLVCHNEIHAPESCSTCHVESKAFPFRPASHKPDFQDTHTSGKHGLDKQSCAVCHGREFHCLGCH